MKRGTWTVLLPTELDKMISKSQILNVTSPNGATTIINLRTAAGNVLKVMKRNGVAFFERGEDNTQ